MLLEVNQLYVRIYQDRRPRYFCIQPLLKFEEQTFSSTVLCCTFLRVNLPAVTTHGVACDVEGVVIHAAQRVAVAALDLKHKKVQFIWKYK